MDFRGNDRQPPSAAWQPPGRLYEIVTEPQSILERTNSIYCYLDDLATDAKRMPTDETKIHGQCLNIDLSKISSRFSYRG